MKALVTGGGGFLGGWIVEKLLARGDSVRVLGRNRYPALESQGVESIVGDIVDREQAMTACTGMDVVFHVAAVAGLGGPERKYRANYAGTKNIVEGCLAHRVGRLVFTSSPSVTFDGADQNGVDESIPYASRFLCQYSASKALAEQHVLAANRAGRLLTCALRPHLIWGPRDTHLIPRLLERARQGRLRRVGDGQNRIDTVYVENAADAHLLAADALRPGSPVAGQAYFISQGEPVNCWDWINQILALAGLREVKKQISFRTAWCLGAFFEGLDAFGAFRDDPPMTRFLAAQLATNHWFNIGRARSELGYEPRISTAEGMKRMAASWRK
jgi:nucleoside-diphosphate-sugar epimerase